MQGWANAFDILKIYVACDLNRVQMSERSSKFPYIQTQRIRHVLKPESLAPDMLYWLAEVP